MPYILGVDGGNTKTIALIARSDGTIIGSGRAGCSDMYGAGSSETALAELDQAIGAALRHAGIATHQIDSATFSLAGADWPEDIALLEHSVQERGYGRIRSVTNDAIGALRAGSPDGTGVVVACGTGTAIGARAADRRTWHSGFWAEHGGAGHLANLALRAAMRSELGITQATALTERLLLATNTPTIPELLRLNTGRSVPEEERPSKARMVRALLDLAAEGNPTAADIVTNHGSGLGTYAVVAARMIGLEQSPFTLVLTGGVFRHPSSLLADALITQVRSQTAGVRPVRSEFEPAVGALLLAFEQTGITITDPIRNHIQHSLPPASFFET